MAADKVHFDVEKVPHLCIVHLLKLSITEVVLYQVTCDADVSSTFWYMYPLKSTHLQRRAQ